MDVVEQVYYRVNYSVSNDDNWEPLPFFEVKSGYQQLSKVVFLSDVLFLLGVKEMHDPREFLHVFLF